MAAGKRKRPLQTYGRNNHYLHAHQRVSFLRAGDFFSPNHDRPDPVISSETPELINKSPLTAVTSSTKGTTRKAAEMAVEPSEEDIQQVVEFSECSRDVAVRYLKVKKTTDAALNAIWEQEDISSAEQAMQWDDSAFSTDRNGNRDTSDSSLRPLGGTSTAPTRVPTPVGNMSAPTNRDDEDAQLAAAMAASQQDAGFGFPQESGVLHADGTSQQTYGPATKDQSAHDRQWGMVPLGKGASSEIVPDVEQPEERKNIDGEPRFIKTLPSGEYLPNFLTIGHAIPSVREALLMRNYVMRQYGKDSEWWKGTQIALPKIVHTDDGAPADAEIDKYDEFIAETQRLMAALDASERSYISAQALTQSELIGNGASDNMVETFINRFIEAAGARTDSSEEMMSLLTTEIGTTSPDGMVRPHAEVLELPVKTTGDEKVGLMEVLDGLLWDTDSEDLADSDNFIVRGAGVIVMCAKQTKPSAEKLQLEVPSTLFIDKYLQDNVSVSKPARLEIAEQKKRVAKIAGIENKLTTWQHPQKSNEQIDARAMLQHTLGHFSGKNMADAGKADLENGIAINGISAPEQPHYADIAARLEAIVLSVDKKLERLREQKDAIQKNISILSNSSPAQLEEDGLKGRYTLMGVATKPSITYVLRPAPGNYDGDRMSIGSNDDDETPDGMQWWRIEYAVNGTHPRISKSKVDGYTVLQAVEVEHTSALLVYASDAAVELPESELGLPDALKEFVADDNLYINCEIHESAMSRPPPAYEFSRENDIPRQSIEPGARRASIDSTVAELGGASNRGSPIISGGPDFYDHAPPNSGLPPDFTNASSAQHVEDPVTEIRLSPSQDDDEADNGALHQEMVETKHEPFVPGLGSRQGRGDVDATMADVRDDSGEAQRGRQ